MAPLLSFAHADLTGNVPPLFAPVLSFGISILASRLNSHTTLTVATVFTSLSIMGLISEPLGMLLASVPTFYSSLGSFHRIQDFVAEAERSTSTPSMPTVNNLAGNGDELELRDMQRLTTSEESPVVIAEHASFAIGADKPPILRNIDLRLEASTLTVVTGKVGSGKSVFLRGMLGELHVTGHLKRAAVSTAYCGQSSWLMNGTVQRNILAQSPMDDEWYDTVVRACALDRDFELFPAGDHSLIGSKGLSLSGGQKQRVACPSSSAR